MHTMYLSFVLFLHFLCYYNLHVFSFELFQTRFITIWQVHHIGSKVANSCICLSFSCLILHDWIWYVFTLCWLFYSYLIDLKHWLCCSNDYRLLFYCSVFGDDYVHVNFFSLNKTFKKAQFCLPHLIKTENENLCFDSEENLEFCHFI